MGSMLALSPVWKTAGLKGKCKTANGPCRLAIQLEKEIKVQSAHRKPIINNFESKRAKYTHTKKKMFSCVQRTHICINLVYSMGVQLYEFHYFCRIGWGKGDGKKIDQGEERRNYTHD